MDELQPLLEHYANSVRFPDVSGFEILELLDVRSKLAAEESRLSVQQRARLENADAEFLRCAPAFYESLRELGELGDLRQRAGAPCSHWWWYLEKLAQRERAKA